MFGYKLVKEEDYKATMRASIDCVSTIQEMLEIIDNLDLSEEVKSQLWAHGIIALSCLIQSEMRLSGHGDFDFERFFNERCKKDEA